MELPRLVSLLGVAVVALVLGVAAAVLWRARRPLAVGLLVASLVGVAGGATVTARMAGVGERHEMIRSYGGISESASGFTADLRHERLSFDGVLYTFRTDAPRDQLLAELQAAYPGGRIAGDTFAVVHAGTRYTVAPGADEEVYELAAETARVSQGDYAVRVAFPPGAVDGDRIIVGEPQPLAIDRAALVGYLDALGTATQTEDGVIIPTSSGARLRRHPERRPPDSDLRPAHRVGE